MARWTAFAALVSGALAGCDCGSSVFGDPDAGAARDGGPDAGPDDAGPADGGPGDAGPTGCTSDEDCAMSPTGERCDRTSGDCVECTADEHCPAGSICDMGACVVRCDDEHPCPDASQTCCLETCVDTMSSRAHCGGCGMECVASFGTAECRDGACAIGSCDSGYADCDAMFETGCETLVAGDLDHCGACGMACPERARAMRTCMMGTCGFVCDAGFADCNGVADDGCETDLATDVAHCGACGMACALASARATCTGGMCAIDACDEGFADCNGVAADGCEVDTRTDVAHCGGCGMACTVPRGTPACAAGACAVGACDSGFADCNGVVGDGCEVDTRTDLAHCGGCGMACTIARGTGSCVAGACTVATCDAGYADCDGSATNGCEAELATDPANCGSCGRSCDDGNACTAGELCAAGICTPPTSTVMCPPRNDCHLPGACDPVTGACMDMPRPDGSPCNDGSLCTTGERCTAGTCGTPTSTVTCTPLDACHVAGTCNPATGVCSNPPAPTGTTCNDGNACTHTDVCSGSGVCAGTPVVCTSDTCTTRTCNGTASCTVTLNDGAACSDGNACTSGETCRGGACGSPTSTVTCTPLGACFTAGTCNPATGACSNPPAPAGTTCNDGNLCTYGDACNGAGSCGGTPITCTGSPPCIARSCNGTASCTTTFLDGTGCNDGNACSHSDRCSGGTCSGTSYSCSPMPCNAVSCDGGGGCNYTNLCSGGQVCFGGACCTPSCAFRQCGVDTDGCGRLLPPCGGAEVWTCMNTRFGTGWFSDGRCYPSAGCAICNPLGRCWDYQPCTPGASRTTSCSCPSYSRPGIACGPEP